MSGLVHESPRNNTVEWYTPPYIFEALGLEFDVDVCSPGAEVVPWVPARRCFTKHDDGLSQRWSGRVWCNPPYGRETARWLPRMADHGHGIALVFSRTDTKWFHEVAPTVDAICFIERRIKFIDGPTGQPAGSPGNGSMLLAWGDDCAQALASSELGISMQPAPVTPVGRVDTLVLAS